MGLERLLICKGCKFRRGRFCGECFCELDAKVEVEDEYCPKGFWNVKEPG